MTKTAALVFLALSIGCSSCALAWSDLTGTITGTIEKINISARDITLDDGKTFSVERGINLAKFKAGDKVQLHIENRNGMKMVAKLTKST
jgi:Cu/Ag efflux protein CusF